MSDKTNNIVCSGKIIGLTLWNEMATEFDMAGYELMQKPIVIALSGSSATHYYLNPNIAEPYQIQQLHPQITDAFPTLNIQTQRHEEPEQEKTRNRFPLSALLEVGPLSDNHPLPLQFETDKWMTNTQTPPPATTVVIPTGAPTTNTVANHAEKPEKFNGQNFKRWQHKMFFYLTTLGLARFLKKTAPQVEPPAEGQSSNAQAVQAVEAWKHSELWESLERKYKTEDAGIKKFVVARFLDYKMVDSKNVISQVQDLQVLLHDIHAEGMTLSETFQVAAIIEKLPPSWVECKNYLKYKRKEMSVKVLVVRLRIEEDNKLAQKDTYAPDSVKANMVEHVGSSSRSNPKGKGKDKRNNDKKSKWKSE
ncbi:hypothetical protein Tco_0815158 [Tanacetum coccineum]